MMINFLIFFSFLTFPIERLVLLFNLDLDNVIVVLVVVFCIRFVSINDANKSNRNCCITNIFNRFKVMFESWNSISCEVHRK
jgi:hypothetical protein